MQSKRASLLQLWKGGHIAKECRTEQKSKQNNSHKLSLSQGFRKGRTAKFYEIRAGENPGFQIVAEDGTNIGTIDYSTVNAIFDNLKVIDSIEIYPVLFQDPRNIQIDELHQTTKSQAFVYVDMYPTDREGSCTGLANQVKCKVDCGAMANIMPLSVFKSHLSLTRMVIPFQGLTGT